MATKQNKLSFTVRRESEFTMSLLEGNQCGISGSHKFGYEFWFTSTELDDRNFVVDHHEVDTALQDFFKHYKVRGSCEQVVVFIGNMILDHIRIALSDKTTLTVKLRGSVTANITSTGVPSMYRNFAPKLHTERK